MIRRIELTNFMSHEHTVLEPAAGLTVIVGPNNCGKSAVVAALQILTNNAESTYVMRHGCKECSVAVETDDGHRIEWRRKTSPSYVIDGQQFDRLRKGGLPAELAPALRLKRVADTEDDIHFGEQKSPLFLIDKPAAHAARFFAASSDVSRLVAMQNRHRTKHNEAKKRKIELEAKSVRLTQELDALAPLADLNQALEQQEAAFRELGQLAEELKHAIRLEGELERATQKLHEYSATTTALAPLTPPPELASTAPLVKWLESWSRESRANDVESARTAALQTLQSPPPLADTQSLASTIQRLTVAAQTYEEYQQRGVALAPLVPPPSLADTTAAASLLQRLTNALLNQRREEQALTSLATLAQPPALPDERPLRVVIDALTTASKRLTKCEAAWTAVQEIQTAPEFSSPTQLADWLQRFDKQTAEFERHQRDLAALQTEALATAEQLRDWARQQQTCPTCGSQLDPERLVTELCTGGGAHDA